MVKMIRQRFPWFVPTSPRDWALLLCIAVAIGVGAAFGWALRVGRAVCP